MQCNIDAKGRTARLSMGIAVVLVGIMLILFWARNSGVAWRRVLAILVVAIGAFQIFQGLAGWCVVRAMGIKTRI